MLLTYIMNICYNEVILLKFIIFFEFYKIFRVCLGFLGFISNLYYKCLNEFFIDYF